MARRMFVQIGRTASRLWEDERAGAENNGRRRNVSVDPFAKVRSKLMKITVLGAGAIGAYVGGCLLATEQDVGLIGRAAMRARIERHGLVVSSHQGGLARISAERVPFFESPDAMRASDLTIVAVKSSATAEAADQIRRHAPPASLVLSLQNGVENVAILRNALPDHVVLGGMVPFNVVPLPDGRLHRGTEGEIMVEDHARWRPWLPVFEAAGLPLERRGDFAAVQWGKLILNLNNAVNALSGLPLKAQLSDRGHRLVFAALIDEALAALSAAGIEPANTGRAPVRSLPALLRLANADFLRIAGGLAGTSAESRSSMWQDLEAGRLTEVEDLNGAVARLASRHGLAAPTNENICALVHAAESGGDRRMSGETLATALGLL
jgi:2-dehydropantoate 2-reductase